MSSCDACVAKDIPTLTAEELSPLMATLHSDWKVAADHKAISRFFKAKDFLQALRYVNAAAAICEEANHHADFHLTNWNNVLVEISTHSAGALTINDVNLAKKLDTITVEFSPRWLKEKSG